MLLSYDYRAFRIVKMPKFSESTNDRESNLVVISAFLALNVPMACTFDLYKKLKGSSSLTEPVTAVCQSIAYMYMIMCPY